MLRIEDYAELFQAKKDRREWWVKEFQEKKITHLKAQRQEIAIVPHITIQSFFKKWADYSRDS